MLDNVVFDYHYPISGWRDQLKQYNGEKFVYDAIGNPTTYRDKTLVWSHGRQLDKFENVEYTYNIDGIRTSKKANGYTTKYYLNGTKILRQEDASNLLDFYYGTDGITGFHLKNNVVDADYYYKKNIQNDIIGIYDSNGKQIVEYIYDAWGNQKARILSNDSINGNSSVSFVDLPENYEYNNTSNIYAFIAMKNPF